MKALADYVHGKGLKLGIYSSPGPKTCAGYEGSYGHEAQDAKTFANWGIDYLKYDWCGASMLHGQQDEQALYQLMGDALLASGRQILYSLCQYGFAQVWRWGGSVGGNLWRTTGDISDKFERMATIGFGQAGLSKYAKPTIAGTATAPRCPRAMRYPLVAAALRPHTARIDGASGRSNTRPAVRHACECAAPMKA